VAWLLLPCYFIFIMMRWWQKDTGRNRQVDEDQASGCYKKQEFSLGFAELWILYCIIILSERLGFSFSKLFENLGRLPQREI